MQKREIFKKIGGIITELNDQYQYLSQNPENLNDLELELFLANSSFLADHIEILRKLNHMPAAASVREAEPAEVAVITPVPEIPPTIDLPSLFSLTEEEADATFEYEKKPVAELFDRQLSPEEQAILDRRKTTGTAPEASPSEVVNEAENRELELPAGDEPLPAVSLPVPSDPVAAQPVTDPAPAKVTIHDVIAAQVTVGTVASRFHTDSVTDLKSIISLNDKLLFVKDLFNGYSLAYSEAIELLNRFNSLEAADNFLKHNYAVKNKWESKPETVEKLYAILNRRFS